jgi:hypothetical protein
MRATIKWTLICALLAPIVCRGVVLAQQPAGQPPPQKQGQTTPDKMSLEELLALALKEHPDVRVAEARLREAEAELSRARMQVAQKVIAHHAAAAATRVAVEEAAQQLARLQKVKGAVTQDELRAAETALAQKKAELARLEAEQPLLLGQWKVTLDARERERFYELHLRNAEGLWRWEVRPRDAAPEGGIADKVRKALDAPITLKFENKPLSDVLGEFKEATGVAFLDMLPQEVRAQKVSLGLSESVPTGAALQALSDLTGVQFAVREYGILVTKGDLPSGAMPLQSFWKGGSWKTNPAPEKKP